jgi:hypothetical protein
MYVHAHMQLYHMYRRGRRGVNGPTLPRPSDDDARLSNLAAIRRMYVCTYVHTPHGKSGPAPRTCPFLRAGRFGSG